MMNATQPRSLAARSATREYPEPEGWIYQPRGIAIRIFLTCWLIYALHLATNTVREIYPALSIGDHFSFRVDEYAGLHPDIFEKKNSGWYINSNPGASMMAAVPYLAARPLIDSIVRRVNLQRAASGADAPEYQSPWPMAREFYKRAWSRGLDIKLGLAAIVIQTLCMAPFSAAAAVLMFLVLRRLLGSDRTAFWLTLLYGFGTPVFFRTGYLNHNLLLGHFAFAGFAILWNPGSMTGWTEGRRMLLAGIAAGTAVLLDYSGVVMLVGLFAYVLVKSTRRPAAILFYLAGCLGPLSLLWFYQWACFGNPFYPAQHWMAPVQWIGYGYQGVGLPELGLLLANAFDFRYGLFVSCPFLLLALAVPLLKLRARHMSMREWAVCFGIPAALLLFAGSVQYSKLQFNTGVRYMAPAVPFLFLPAALVLVRLSKRVMFAAAAVAVAQAWSMAMYRDVERGLGVLDPALHVLAGGFQLPLLTVLSRMGSFGEYAGPAASPLPLFAVTALILYGIWSTRLANGPWRER